MTREHPPPLPRTLVHRPRLLERVDAGVRGPLTLVSGPAGAGKTTLLADWAHARATADDHRTVLWRTVETTAQAGDLLAQLTRAAPLPGASPLVAIVDGLGAHAAERAHDPALAERVAALLRERTDALHVVLATRGEPPLPLGRVRLDATVVELGPAELAFTWEEARSLLAARLPAAQAHARWEQVEGWAAGLTREPSELPAYVERELLGGLGDELRDFLLRVSVADELTPELAAVLTGAADAGGTLDRLARAHALVVPLDRHGGGYRLARPLREALRAALPAALPGEASELHRRAAEWHGRAGDALAAARHALAAGAPELAADTLAGAWLDLLARGRDVEMAELLAAMPAATLAGDPELRVCAGALATARDAVAQALDRRFDGEAAAGATRDSMGATLAAARLRLARLEGDVPAAADAAAALSDAGPDGGEAWAETGAEVPGGLAAQRRRRTLALQQLGVAELVAGSAAGAAAHLEQALGTARAEGFDHLAAACLGPLCGLDAQRGRLRSAAAWGAAAIELAERIDDRRPAVLVPAHVGLAVVAWLRDERFAAEAELARAEACLAEAGPAADPLAALTVRLPAAWLAAADARAAGPAGGAGTAGAAGRAGTAGAAGRAGTAGAAGAETELARLEEAAARALLAAPRLPDWLLLALDEARVKLLLALGRTGAAANAASAPRGPSRPERLLLGAHVALAREDPAEARWLADRFLARATTDTRPAHVLEGMLLQASTTYELGTVWDALSWLERAIAAAAEERCRRPFAEAGAPIGALLRVLARRGPWPPVGFVAELLDERPAGTAAEAPGDSALSQRERAILRYLPSGLSKREIAGELGVSANTVKTHVSSIYRKLDVRSRAQAVARARELGLLAR
ncbi:LuxR C-terminal-related transcriptional regulator [Conexibacter woesei]|uniref:ATP-dependent transcriptional regulator, MalT-like, LuxR family n=1 Tax=Conexibacter woesei (strain DSM 14684 / CCUG 47730 / CIP 108061 / JCM 11494 / NBRC 100937 / ID131577) TaxID=469383 RepID=D3EZX5_CONWI|nr:LuxR C-terminal-related transcriptional regulator [Conexibacter woesei]ADB49951.1 ATP-dependent transcriptional regulator, MalT- like, LuxR family [Conexibacter woesei DSM 14684]